MRHLLAVAFAAACFSACSENNPDPCRSCSWNERCVLLGCGPDGGGVCRSTSSVLCLEGCDAGCKRGHRSLNTLRRVNDEAAQWDAPADALYINTTRFTWEAPGGVVDLRKAVTTDGNIPWHPAPPSLYEKHARLKLLDRGALGWIAVHWDKRDDDMLPFSSLPRRVVLTRHGGTEKVTVIVNENAVTFDPPMVEYAVLTTRPLGNGQFGAHLAFRCIGSQAKALENVWRARVAAIVNGAPRHLVDVTREQCHFDAQRGEYDYGWTVTSQQEAALLTQEGRNQHATSVWFEDAVGHVATPEELLFSATT